MRRAPLRFLLTVMVLWAGARAAILLPAWSGRLALLPQAAAETPPRPAPMPALRAPAGAAPILVLAPLHAVAVGAPLPRSERQAEAAPAILLAGSAQARVTLAAQDAARPAPAPGPIGFAPSSLRPTPAGSSRWSVSAWLLVRDEGGAPPLAPGGTLGGSQAGARIVYAPGGGLALSARVYLPWRESAGAELAAGVDWQPASSLPVHLLVERRQRLGRDGRRAFALTVYGGASTNLGPRLRLDVYGQAGVVGLHSRDLFADGALRLSRRIGPVELGAGAWGAAQPGAARLDAGPSLAWRLPVPRANLRLQADWRFRLAGEAAPGSGPALTLATDF